MDNEKVQLLKKNDTFQYESNDIFKNDVLDRKILIENLSTLLWSSDQPLVVSIESPWGTGKTVFVTLWKLFLEKENTPCIYFNAWENDFAVDPIIPFLNCFDKFVHDEIKNIDDSALKGSVDKIKKVGGYLAKKTIPVAIKIITQGVIDLNDENLGKIVEDEISDLFSGIAEDSVEEFSKKKDGITILQENLKKVSKKIIEDNKKRGPLVCFIDELDRCKPDFAVLLLERLKHIFSVDGVVFVLSVDRDQLETSVKSIYGNGTDAVGYLLRFINYRFKLPVNSGENFYNQLINKFGINQIFATRRKVNQNYEEKIFQENYEMLIEVFKLSLREQEQLFTELNVFLRTLPEKYLLIPGLVIFLNIIKYKDEQFFDRFIYNEINLEEFEEKFASYISNLEENDNKYKLGFLQGTLMYFLTKNRLFEKKYLIPDHYLTIDESDSYLRGKFKGFKVGDNSLNQNAFIESYFKSMKLMHQILL